MLRCPMHSQTYRDTKRHTHAYISVHRHSSASPPVLWPKAERKRRERGHGFRNGEVQNERKAEQPKMGEEMRERERVGMSEKEERRWQRGAGNGRCCGHHIKAPALSGCSDRGACVIVCVCEWMFTCALLGWFCTCLHQFYNHKNQHQTKFLRTPYEIMRKR